MKYLLLLTLANVTALAADAPPVQLKLSVNNAGECDLPQGWPLIVQTQILSATPFSSRPAAPVVLAAPNGRWPAAIHFTIVAPDGSKMDRTPDFDPTPVDGRLELASNEVIELSWGFAPDVTSALQVGKYSLHASLDLSSAPEGWLGVISASANINVLAASDPQRADADPFTQRSLLLAEYSTVRGDLVAAAAQLDALIAAIPRSYSALLARALIFERQGSFSDAARMATAAAVAWYRTDPPPREPPAGAMELKRRVAPALRNGPNANQTSPGTPPR